MSSPIVVPFNFEPVSISVKTSSYTIPQGKYANCKNLDAEATINNEEVGLMGTYSLNGVVSGTAGFVSLPIPIIGDFANFTYSFQRTSGSVNCYAVYGVRSVTAGFAPYQSIDFNLTATSSAGFFSSSKDTVLNQVPIISVGATTNSIIQSLPVVGIVPAGGLANQFYSTTLKTFHSSREYWAPSGSVLSGGRWLVTEYNSIS
jgi:hypothetical protein